MAWAGQAFFLAFFLPGGLVRTGESMNCWGYIRWRTAQLVSLFHSPLTLGRCIRDSLGSLYSIFTAAGRGGRDGLGKIQTG